MKSAPKTINRDVLLAANSSWNLVNFRAPIIAGLQKQGFRVMAAVPDDDSASALRIKGTAIHHIPIDARGISPLKDAHLFLSYRKLLRRLKPAAYLGFTAKPNIYGSAAAGRLGIPVINTITGLGTAFLSGQTLETIVTHLYRWGLQRSQRVFFHNTDDRDLFVARGIVTLSQTAVVPGSGIDLDYFTPAPPQAPGPQPTFLFIGRFLKDKGATEFAQAATIMKNTQNARFQMLGSIEDHPKAAPREIFDDLVSSGTIDVLGTTADVRPFIANADCIVLPSYREGLPRVLLEASAMAKPVIATDVPGCRQAVDDQLTGYLCEARSAASLADAMTRFAQMAPEERAIMGARGRQKAEREFSQKRVVATYLEALHEMGVSLAS
jgi:glycosyltransferase involved in cell wall biosynthesis